MTIIGKNKGFISFPQYILFNMPPISSALPLEFQAQLVSKHCRGIKSSSHTHFTAFTLYPQKLPFILAEITAIPPQEHSMQVMPGSLFRRVAGAHALICRINIRKNVRETIIVFIQRTDCTKDSDADFFYSTKNGMAP